MEAKIEPKYQCQCIYKNSTPSAFSHTVACWEYNKGFKAGYHQREIDPLDKEDRCEKCYEQGIREVVDYINNRGIANSFFPVNTRRQWEDQLKEWGIKED